jgi:dipeptidyl aminopeptidase/acylaminoacyl peptidase
MEPIEASDHHDIVRVSEPRLSPDGERVTFVRRVPSDGESVTATIHVVPADGGEDPRRFTLTDGVDAEPRWSPSGDRLAFVSTRGEGDRPQLWVVPVDGGEARQVTDVPGGVSAPSWDPDGERLAFVQSVTADERGTGTDVDASEADERTPPDPRVLDRLVYRADEHYFDGTRSHVYVADLDGDVERVTDGEYDYGSPAWSDDTLYVTAKRTDDPDDNTIVDVLACDPTTGEAETVFRTSEWVPTIAVTDDDRIAYTHTPPERGAMGQTDLLVYDRGNETTATLTDDLDRTVETPTITWDREGESVHFVTPDEGAFAVRRANGDGSGDVETVVTDGHVTGVTAGGGRVAFARSEWDHPDDVFVHEDSTTTRLTRVNEAYLADHAVAEPEPIRFGTDDGPAIEGWVLTPPDDAGDGERSPDADEPSPLITQIHGGPHTMWTAAGTMWHEFQTLAARGYAVFWSNPRGSTGYGQGFAAAIERDWGAVTMADVLAGVERVTDRGDIDGEECYVTGGSFGGFMTGWIVGHTDRFRAAVAQRGVYDLLSFYGSTDAFKLVEWDFDTTPWEEPAFLWEHSPVAHADAVDTPTLLIHAEDDYRVPVNNGEMFYLFLKKNGVDTRLVRYPREGHELSRSGEPAHVVDRIERIVRWFDGYSARVDAPRALDRGDEGLSATDDED